MNTEILIVEDEGLIALDLKKKLELAGYAIAGIADNAEDALVSVERLRPALVLMDIRLRGAMDGVETADQIRWRFHVPVIFVTAHADRETLNRARITEPFGYIVKPFHGIDFRVQIEVALWKHKMEQRLRVSEAWLSATFRNVADALICTDEQGNIALMNSPAELLTGWDIDKAKGKPFPEVFRAADEITGLPVERFLPNFKTIEPDTAEEGETGSGVRVLLLTPRGSQTPVIVETEFSVNRDEGKTFGVIVAFRDITERRKAERRERQVQKMNALTLMATGLGRELSESQGKMDESIKYLIEVSSGEKARVLWDVYEHSAHQQTIIQQLITLGMMDAGKAVVLDLNQVLTEIREPMRKTLGVHRSLKFDLQPGIPAIQADPRRLRENLIRLVADSRQTAPKGGFVEISTTTIKTRDNRVAAQLIVRDNRKVGRGAKERAFDPYYQSTGRKRNPGFSLALVCQFVALSGGSIEIETGADEGSAYLVTFPAASGVPVAPIADDTSSVSHMVDSILDDEVTDPVFA